MVFRALVRSLRTRFELTNNMNTTDFRQHGHQLVDWIADYLENLHTLPVTPDQAPGDTLRQLPRSAPEKGEPFDAIFQDFQRVILPGITHWQHPQFLAYFPCATSEPSILAEMLASGLGVNTMLWLTSPAATELEERVMQWLRDLLGLPAGFTGVIQDTASTATLVALLTAREKYTNLGINQSGFTGKERFRVYASEQVHSSIDKDVKILGIGLDNLVKIPTDNAFAMVPEALEARIQADIAAGYRPLAVVSCIGTTSSTAIDPVDAIGDICKKYDCWHHVDAAYAGTALLLPEMRWMSKGVEKADSFLVNPHKWMFTSFDCTAYFVQDKEQLIRTFSILPEYLKTAQDSEVNNYRDWGIQLGRRFRALKLWFVMRTYGAEGLKAMIASHIEMGQWLKAEIEQSPDFELLAPAPLNLVCFRYHPAGLDDEDQLNRLNERLLTGLNATHRILLTQTKLNGKYTLRIVNGQANSRPEYVRQAWGMVVDVARSLKMV